MAHQGSIRPPLGGYWMTEAPADGARHAGLPPCPAWPRGVSSLAEWSCRWVAPIAYAGGRDDAWSALRAAIAALPRTEIVACAGETIHATQRTVLFGFVDDLTCWLPPDEAVIHVHSAARVGYYDLGVNRRRVERLRRAFQTHLR